MYKGEEWVQLNTGQIVRANDYFVKNANEATIQTANKFIFSRTKNFKFVKTYLEEQGHKIGGTKN